MKYVQTKDANQVRLGDCGSISATGSVSGMQKLYGWKKGEQVRIGAWIFNVGAAEVARLRSLGILKGE